MKVALGILFEALRDSLIILPFLFLVYVLIEVIEMYSISNLRTKHLLQGKLSPLIASSVGLIPQCGFSVVATDLYAKRYISMGTLLAVFIATSDEAIPIMLSNFGSAKMLIPMLLIKFFAALIVGYSFYLIQNIMDKKNSNAIVATTGTSSVNTNKDNATKNISVQQPEQHTKENVEHDHDHEHEHDHDDDLETKLDSVGCCGHHLEEQPTKLQRFLWHPLIHSLKIFAFILVVNIILGSIIELVGGAENLGNILGVNTFWQPLVSTLVGLIPNCASSVAITQLYVAGTLSFGATISGLTANAGVAYVVLFKHNKNIKQNLIIIASMYIISVLMGLITMLII